MLKGGKIGPRRNLQKEGRTKKREGERERFKKPTRRAKGGKRGRANGKRKTADSSFFGRVKLAKRGAVGQGRISSILSSREREKNNVREGGKKGERSLQRTNRRFEGKKKRQRDTGGENPRKKFAFRVTTRPTRVKWEGTHRKDLGDGKIKEGGRQTSDTSASWSPCSEGPVP